MAHGPKSNEKIVYVGDSRVRKSKGFITPPDYTSYPGKSEAFIPNFLLKEWMVAVVALVGVLCLVMSDPAPLGYPANPMATVIPMPDWYFLFMYQLLKYPYAAGDFVIVGTMLVPGIMFGALILAPFLDTGKERRFYKRPIASSIMLVTLAAVTYLTVFSWHHYQLELKEKGMVPEHIKREEELHAQKAAAGGGNKGEAPKKAASAIVAKDDPGYEVFQKSSCIQCHGGDLKGKIGPTLIGIGDKHPKDELMKIVKEGIGGMGAQYDANKNLGLSDADIDKMVSWLALQKK
ncbi:c-type cytochrome [Paenibacillus sp. N1-5-1-14]|uniref:menaquinol-cytochrome c reductase cytochrome b/c subunit n=1 Tax=Paenibacillus radicibacter TaxID=2972488 RepID=UPI0021595C54|nr:menaquinol-cytochrome c reductase cytochrome b/c subunit [Paenibacillus radicibacter]MCR8642262.1 c-type cytochrome [Paenibacillus radicibacter]